MRFVVQRAKTTLPHCYVPDSFVLMKLLMTATTILICSMLDQMSACSARSTVRAIGPRLRSPTGVSIT